MLICLDVDYRDPGAVAAGVLFEGWPSAAPSREIIALVERAEPYEPGSFYKRELPCLLAVLARVTEPLEAVVIDGYVWLDGAGRRGLGAHLFEHLGQRTPVVGVAKTAFAGADATPVLRGESKRPLWVTAAGLPADEAAARVASMHGPHRVPTLLQRVDRLCRSAQG